MTASHIGRGYHGLKNHDWMAVPMCSSDHWMYEYSPWLFRAGKVLPTFADADKLFRKFLEVEGLEDDRTPEQMEEI